MRDTSLDARDHALCQSHGLSHNLRFKEQIYAVTFDTDDADHQLATDSVKRIRKHGNDRIFGVKDGFDGWPDEIEICGNDNAND